MIHIVNGDVVGNKIVDLEGDLIVWREMYDFGPLGLSWSKEEFIKKRAEFFEEKLCIPSSFFITNCQAQNRLLRDLPRTEEIVLWFEHDRYDQTMLMYLLEELMSNGFRKLSMVSIDQYPGITPFYGLGRLSSNQLKGLVDLRKRISAEQVKEAITGWHAYNSKDANDIEKWIVTENHSLPYLLQTMKNYRNYFPSSKTGLNEVEFLALYLIQQGIDQFKELFKKITERRINDGLSDLHFAAILNELMRGEQPLLVSNEKLPNFSIPESNAELEITTAGLDVLKGRRNRMDVVGIDWWVGGVHLHR
ncbi:DUF1835 domain-containing protein [Metabacillus arenae]|uniref:DUF1835 domain-containing protein n=1 Tax=Metabacillus arenae TaxID=2771434 RepID=A0A926RYY5_9BACI|nr:DUF1835 domain-containing protein [Metabacillus arenae]MBD1382250.1 DUF1835 domain-containing protein [Metabacillus arenae]